MSKGVVTDLQQRCNYLSPRCFTGFSKHDKEKKNPIPEEKALAEWKELTEKRFLQPNSGAFLLLRLDGTVANAV